MKKLLQICFLTTALFIVSCKKDITDLNINPNEPLTVASEPLFSNAENNLSDLMAHTNVNFNNFRLFVQYWTETIYRDEVRYNLNQRSIPDRWFATLYRDVIKDLTEASKVIDGEGMPAAKTKNRKAINEMLIVYSYYVLISTFGDVPYTDALNVDILQPKYDKASVIFDNISTRLNNALAAMDVSAESYGDADLILGGDNAAWMKFGNCLKMRMGMLIADSDPAKSKAMVEAAAPNVIMNNGENLKMHFLSSPPNTNPVWEDLVQSGRFDFVAAKPFVDTLNAYNDPRLPQFFNPSIDDTLFVGQNPGSRAAFNSFASPSDKVKDPTAPFAYFDYAEMEFYKAEAMERGYSVGGTAETHYNNAIMASIEDWGGSTAEGATYLAQPSVAYTTATGDYKEKIGVQSWIAFYNRGYDSWTQWRRLDYPKLSLPFFGAVNPYSTGETPAVIVRMNYPVIEQNLNKANYEAASSSIGKDWKTQHLWFDKF